MDTVQVVALQSFVNAITGTVSPNQVLKLPVDYAEFLIAEGLVRRDDGEVQEPIDAKKSSPSPNPADAGKAQPSASLPPVTPSAISKSQKPKAAAKPKAGKPSR